MKWIQVDKEQAMLHKLYGVGGWLLVLQILMIFGFFVTWGAVTTIVNAVKVGQGIPFWFDGSEFVDYVYFVFFINVLQIFIFFYAIYFKPKGSRSILIFSLISFYPISLILSVFFGVFREYQFVYLKSGLLLPLITYLVFALIVVLYFNNSKRVRCTFDFTISESDALKMGFDGVYSASNPTGLSENKAINLIDDNVWSELAREFNQNRDEGLWTRLFVKNNGDENAAKLQYLKIKGAERVDSDRSTINSDEQYLHFLDEIKKGQIRFKENGIYKCYESKFGFCVLETLDHFIVYPSERALENALRDYTFYDDVAPNSIKKFSKS